MSIGHVIALVALSLIVLTVVAGGLILLLTSPAPPRDDEEDSRCPGRHEPGPNRKEPS